MPTNPQCGTCKTEQGLVRCQGCQVVFYCGREHQASDWPHHKLGCKQIKKTRQAVAAEVDLLNAMPGSWMFERNPLRTQSATSEELSTLGTTCVPAMIMWKLS